MIGEGKEERGMNEVERKGRSKKGEGRIRKKMKRGKEKEKKKGEGRRRNEMKR